MVHVALEEGSLALLVRAHSPRFPTVVIMPDPGSARLCGASRDTILKVHKLDAEPNGGSAAGGGGPIEAPTGDHSRGQVKFLRKYAAFTLPVIDESLLDPPDESTRSMLLELLERHCDAVSTVFCTQRAKKDWHHRLGSGIHAPGPQPHSPDYSTAKANGAQTVRYSGSRVAGGVHDVVDAMRRWP